MATEKAIYWAAVAVLTLFMGSHLANRYDGECLTQRVQAVTERFSGHSGRVISMAQVMFGRTPSQLARGEAAIARTQCKLASLQTSLARQQVACARVEAERVRMMSLRQVQQFRFETRVPEPVVDLEVSQPVRVLREDPI